MTEVTEPHGAPAAKIEGAVRFALDFLIETVGAFGILALAVLLGATIIDVVGRFFGAPLLGSVDITTTAFCCLIFPGIAMCEKLDKHISVDLVDQFVRPRTLAMLGIVANAVGAAVFAVLAWSFWKLSLLALLLNQATNSIGIPRAPVQIFCTACCALVAVSMTFRIIELLRRRAISHPENKIGG